MIKFPAKITYSKKDKCYLVDFPDLPGCNTYGDSIDEAINYAKEALSGFLESINLRELDLPNPTKLNGKDIYFIEPDNNISFAIWLKKTRIKKGYTQKELAKLLNIPYQSYQRYENPKITNPTLKRISQIEDVLEEKIVAI
jgi:antitoxin HicB